MSEKTRGVCGEGVMCGEGGRQRAGVGAWVLMLSASHLRDEEADGLVSDRLLPQLPRRIDRRLVEEVRQLHRVDWVREQEEQHAKEGN